MIYIIEGSKVAVTSSIDRLVLLVFVSHVLHCHMQFIKIT